MIARADIDLRQERLLAAYAAFEDMVEALIDASRYGPTSSLDLIYRQAVATLLDARKEFGPYLRAYQIPREADPLDALLGSDGLSEAIAEDSFAIAHRVTRSRESFNRYAEHLRRLAEARR